MYTGTYTRKNDSFHSGKVVSNTYNLLQTISFQLTIIYMRLLFIEYILRCISNARVAKTSQNLTMNFGKLKKMDGKVVSTA